MGGTNMVVGRGVQRRCYYWGGQAAVADGGTPTQRVFWRQAHAAVQRRAGLRASTHSSGCLGTPPSVGCACDKL